MTDVPQGQSPQAAMDALRSEIERLKAEVLVARQRAEFEHLLLQHRKDHMDAFETHKKDVHSQINRRLLALTGIGVIVAGMALWSAIQPVRQLVTNRLNTEFASENIKSLISDSAQRAAEAQAKQMMEGTLKPAVNEARAQMAKQSGEIKEFAEGLRRESKGSLEEIRGDFKWQVNTVQTSMLALLDEYRKDLSQLRVEVDFQRRLREIQKLRNDAIDGDSLSFAMLGSYKSEDDSLRIAARITMLEVKGFYLLKSRTKGVILRKLNPDGSEGPKNEQLLTAELLEALRDSSLQWTLRAKAAELLGSRKEKGVAEGLLQAMQSDANLWVRRNALEAFAVLTGFVEVDVFDFQRAGKWWEENRQM